MNTKKLKNQVLSGLLLWLVCGCPATVHDDDDDADIPSAPDPLDFAQEVEQSRLEQTISDLEGIGTRYTFSSGDEQARDYLVTRIEALGLLAELDPFTVGDESADNIIVRHTGSEEPDVVFIFSAHYDSTSNEPSSYAPGADDNASAVAAVLEALRLLTPHNFRYSLWFVFTAAEEQGSLGSEHMVEWLAAEPIEVRGVIAPDMIGYWPLGDDDLVDILGDEDSEHLVERVANIADLLGVAHKTWIFHNYCYGDDHSNFQEASFPAISAMDCVEAHNLPESGESTPHYHRSSDRLETLHMPFTTRVTGLLTASLADLGQPISTAN